jgi:hypothetical protein
MNKVIHLADEIANCRDIEIPEKLLKLKELIQSDDITKKFKYDIYKYGLLEALCVSLKQDYGYINDGWKKASELCQIAWFLY